MKKNRGKKTVTAFFNTKDGKIEFEIPRETAIKIKRLQKAYKKQAENKRNNGK